MLTHLSIRHFAIIDELELEFDRGLSTLTGETGAGKSILLDALQLVLGDRADSDMVKQGCDKAEVRAGFLLENLPQVQNWLAEHELEADEECLIRRVVSANGRSKAFINGVPVTLVQCRELGEQLVDIHGQHEHQSLLKANVQLALLDAAAQQGEALQQLKLSWKQWQNQQKQLQQAIDSQSQGEKELELLRFQFQELEALNLERGEIAQLQQEYQRLASSEKLLKAANLGLQLLEEQDEVNVLSMLRNASLEIGAFTELDDKLKDAHELLDSATIQCRESASLLRSMLDQLDMDPARLDFLNQRIASAQSLARKHQVEVDDLPQTQQQLLKRLEQLDNLEHHIGQLQKHCEAAQVQYQQQAQQISQTRLNTATQLGQEISAIMHRLGMQGGCFSVEVRSDLEQASASGIDQISFNVSANPGQTPKPLARVASGGELSRISLAIQVVLSGAAQIPTLIFDEVDSGIGGGIAEIVGAHLQQLGKRHQVLCVTHLPQVAAHAHQHFKVEKQRGEDSTSTSVRPLSDTQRQDEIARMLGGIEITATTLAHAQEMIAGAHNGQASLL